MVFPVGDGILAPSAGRGFSMVVTTAAALVIAIIPAAIFGRFFRVSITALGGGRALGLYLPVEDSVVLDRRRSG